MDLRLTQVPAVRAVEERLVGLVGLVVGLYVGGSVATGDYRAGVSDIDVVALTTRTPDRATRRSLVDIHRALVTAEPGAEALHCVYVPRDRTEGRLATKSEAIGRLAGLGLPADIVAGIAARRRGERVPLTAPEAEHRAAVVRAFMRHHIARLLDEATRPDPRDG